MEEKDISKFTDKLLNKDEGNEMLASLRSLLNKDFVEKLRILDPRLTHYSIYVELDDSDVEKILKKYPDAKITYTLFKKVSSITVPGKVGFTIFNVPDNKRDNLIKKHDEEYQERKEKDRKNNILY